MIRTSVTNPGAVTLGCEGPNCTLQVTDPGPHQTLTETGIIALCHRWAFLHRPRPDNETHGQFCSVGCWNELHNRPRDTPDQPHKEPTND